MKRACAIRMDANGDPIEVKKFEWVEDALAWCNTERGAPLLELDSQIGFVLLTEAENERISQCGEYPPIWFSVTGFDEETGEERDILEEDWRDE